MGKPDSLVCLIGCLFVLVEALNSERIEGRPDLSFIYKLNVCVLVEALGSKRVDG